ncbi:MAG: ATP-binding protein [Deltaproteobacteria bacterium]|nr:ATP-binding protein [Deltaproteobacteria bacterium]
MFVNRKNEIERLTTALNQESVRLIILYGRRRCGKSALLHQVLPEHSVYFASDLREKPLQISALANQISNLVSGFDRAVYPDWETILLTFNRSLKRHTILCIDEFPYLVKNSPELPSVIQHILDTHKQLQFSLIICGSAQQMMQGIAINSNSPLYGRSDEILRIRVMELPHIREYLQTKETNAVEEYSVWGGVPRYWEIRKKSATLAQAIRRHVIDQNGLLYDEPERLFADEMRTSVQAFSVISLIANGSNRISEIAGRLGKPATQLTRLLSFLIDLGYIRREIPYGEHPCSSKRGLYKINDPFLNFWFTFVIPQKSRLESGLADEVWKDISSRLNNFVSGEWETQCRGRIAFLEADGKRFLPASRWWGPGYDKKTLELDLVADSTDGSAILVGEVKWSENPGLLTIENRLTEKIRQLPFTGNKKIIRAIFLKSKPSHYSGESVLFDAKDVCHSNL